MYLPVTSKLIDVNILAEPVIRPQHLVRKPRSPKHIINNSAVSMSKFSNREAFCALVRAADR
jgi:hypothetical protein